jgi:hypothetical protein
MYVEIQPANIKHSNIATQICVHTINFDFPSIGTTVIRWRLEINDWRLSRPVVTLFCTSQYEDIGKTPLSMTCHYTRSFGVQTLCGQLCWPLFLLPLSAARLDRGLHALDTRSWLGFFARFQDLGMYNAFIRGAAFTAKGIGGR